MLPISYTVIGGRSGVFTCIVLQMNKCCDVSTRSWHTPLTFLDVPVCCFCLELSSLLTHFLLLKMVLHGYPKNLHFPNNSMAVLINTVLCSSLDSSFMHYELLPRLDRHCPVRIWRKWSMGLCHHIWTTAVLCLISELWLFSSSGPNLASLATSEF